MQTFNAYSLALVGCESHFSMVKAASILPGISHDQLTRSLHTGGFTGITDWEKLPPLGILIVDDTAIAKPYSRNIEGVDWVYSSSQQQTVLGLTCQLVLWRVEDEVFVLDVMICEKGGLKHNERFRQSLLRLYELDLQPQYVTFDTWYAAQETLELVHELGWTYVTKLRVNRLFNGRHLQDHLFYGANSRTGQLKGVNHTVQVVKHGDNYFATNCVEPVNTRWVSTRYRKRWAIETVFRDLKDVLHLENCRARSLKAQFNHILACLEVYQLLQRTFPNHSIQSAQQQFLRQCRSPILNTQAFLAYAA